jgi:hypothetical protein
MRQSDLDDVCPSIGYTATRRLQEWYAGRSLYVPLHASDSHPLALVIGEPALRALCRDWAGGLVRVPSRFQGEVYRRERLVAEMIAQGRTLSEIATEVGLTVRRIQQLQHVLHDRGWLEFAEFRTAAGRARKDSVREAPTLRTAAPPRGPTVGGTGTGQAR